MSRHNFKMSIYGLAALIALPMLGTACSKSPASGKASAGSLQANEPYATQPIPEAAPESAPESAGGYAFDVSGQVSIDAPEIGQAAQDIAGSARAAAADIKKILEVLKKHNQCQDGYSKCSTLKDSDFASIENNYDFGPVRNACYRPHQFRSSFCYEFGEPDRRLIWGDRWRDALSPWGWDWPEDGFGFDDIGDDWDLESERLLFCHDGIEDWRHPRRVWRDWDSDRRFFNDGYDGWALGGCGIGSFDGGVPFIDDGRAIIEICRRGVDELVTQREAYRIFGFDIFHDFRGAFRGRFDDDDVFGDGFGIHLGRCREGVELIDDDFRHGRREGREGRDGRDGRGGHEGRDDRDDDEGDDDRGDRDDRRYGDDDDDRYGDDDGDRYNDDDDDYGDDSDYDDHRGECHHRDDCDHHDDCDCCQPHGCDSDRDCNDENACTVDACNLTTGVCTHTTLDCDDDNACTLDSCETDVGCIYTAVPDCACTTNADCNDNNPCTTDTCSPIIPPATVGLCEHTNVTNGPIVIADNECVDSALCSDGMLEITPVVCPNSDTQCNVATCDPATGCLLTPVPNGQDCFINDGLTCALHQCILNTDTGASVCTVLVPALNCDPTTQTCETVCPIAGTDTDGDRECVFLNNDSENCGECGKVCGSEAEAGLDTCCSGVCVDTTLSPNCGGCGVTCGVGVNTGLNDCCGAAGCVDTTSDPDNCNGCGNVCPDNLPLCVDSTCTSD